MPMKHFLTELRTEVYDLANDPEGGGLRLSALTRVLLDRLEEAGIISDGHLAYYEGMNGRHHAAVHGYSYDADEESLSLYFVIDANQDVPLDGEVPVATVPKVTIDRAFKALEAFVGLCQREHPPDMEESQPAAESCSLLRDARASRREVVLTVLTTGTLGDRAFTARESPDQLRSILDLVGLFRLCGRGAGGESISIDFEREFQQPLPCLVTKTQSDGLRVILTCVRGDVLAAIYNQYRARLLERNVRSFLQFTGKVNKGIRATLLERPERFLAYNNGLAATASRVDLTEHRHDGLARVRAVHDFQIVNGGQTTASIASCVRRDQADLKHVFVAIKLTEVPREIVADLVPEISRCANLQNRIQEADFSANDPWHIELERVSRTILDRPHDVSTSRDTLVL